MAYRKSRRSYPDGVLLIADNGGKTMDRYTVLYTPTEDGNFPYVGMSERPFDPNGFGQHGELPFRYSVWGRNEKVLEWEELPEQCRQLVLQDIAT